MPICISVDGTKVRSIEICTWIKQMYLRLRLDDLTLPAQFNGQNLCYLCYGHAANAMNFLIVMLHKAITVPA
jgi:hypothetical protein